MSVVERARVRKEERKPLIAFIKKLKSHMQITSSMSLQVVHLWLMHAEGIDDRIIKTGRDLPKRLVAEVAKLLGMSEENVSRITKQFKAHALVAQDDNGRRPSRLEHIERAAYSSEQHGPGRGSNAKPWRFAKRGLLGPVQQFTVERHRRTGHVFIKHVLQFVFENHRDKVRDIEWLDEEQKLSKEERKRKHRALWASMRNWLLYNGFYTGDAPEVSSTSVQHSSQHRLRFFIVRVAANRSLPAGHPDKLREVYTDESYIHHHLTYDKSSLYHPEVTYDRKAKSPGQRYCFCTAIQGQFQELAEGPTLPAGEVPGALWILDPVKRRGQSGKAAREAVLSSMRAKYINKSASASVYRVAALSKDLESLGEKPAADATPDQMLQLLRRRIERPAALIGTGIADQESAREMIRQAMVQAGDLSKLKKNELEAILAAGNTTKTGNKPALIDRINGIVNGTVPIVTGRQKRDPKDYHRTFNRESYRQWFVDKLLKNLKHKSLIIMDGLPPHFTYPDEYHQVHKRPRAEQEELYWSIMEDKIGPAVDVSGLGPEEAAARRQAAVDARKAEFARYKGPVVKALLQQAISDHVDFELVAAACAQGHEILVTPPHFSNLQPIEMFWGRVKGNMRRAHDFQRSFRDVREVLVEQFEELGRRERCGEELVVHKLIENVWRTEIVPLLDSEFPDWKHDLPDVRELRERADKEIEAVRERARAAKTRTRHPGTQDGATPSTRFEPGPEDPFADDDDPVAAEEELSGSDTDESH